MAWQPGSWQQAGGTRSDQTLCRTVLAGPGTPGWELSERSRAHRLRVSAWLPLSFSAFPCLQLSLPAMLSPLPASRSLHRAVSPAASSAPSSRAGRSRRRAAPSPLFTGPLIQAGKREQCPQAAAAEHLQEPLRQLSCVPGESFFLTRHSSRPPLPDPPQPRFQLSRATLHSPQPPRVPCPWLSPFPGPPSLHPGPTNRAAKLQAASQGRWLWVPTEAPRRPPRLSAQHGAEVSPG